MALAIATNTGALMAAASATSVNKDMSTSMERLASGKRINSAADDAAGVAIASRLSSEIRGTNQAIRNAMDGQALIDTAEGAHKEIENILQRMRELAVQSANDTNDSSDRANLQAEFKALTTEIDRIAGATTWAGQTLLNGGANAGQGAASFTFQVGQKTGSVDNITVNINAMSSAALGNTTEAVNVEGTPTVGTGAEAGGTATNNVLTMAAASDSNATPASVIFEVQLEGKTVEVLLPAGISAEDAATAVANAVNADSDLNVVASVNGADVTFTEGAAFDISTRDKALTMIEAMDTAIATVNTQRAELGAVSNRLDNTVNNLTNIVIQLEGGKGRIEDADFAAESTNLAKTQILQQASTAMLAQANASKQNVLSLLQG
jgi:flagellin